MLLKYVAIAVGCLGDSLGKRPQIQDSWRSHEQADEGKSGDLYLLQHLTFDFE